jgi:hypothetical protein
MSLLRFEFNKSPEGSINGMLRKLVTELRYNRSQVKAEEFHRRMPELRQIEARIQQNDAEIHLPKREYINEIMAELDKESDNEMNLEEDLRGATLSIIASLLNRSFSFEDLIYRTGKSEHYCWLHFSGYGEQKSLDAELILAKEIFRSVCNKYGYVFIDLS